MENNMANNGNEDGENGHGNNGANGNAGDNNGANGNAGGNNGANNSGNAEGNNGGNEVDEEEIDNKGACYKSLILSGISMVVIVILAIIYFLRKGEGKAEGIQMVFQNIILPVGFLLSLIIFGVQFMLCRKGKVKAAWWAGAGSLAVAGVPLTVLAFLLLLPLLFLAWVAFNFGLAFFTKK